eukprot:CAMPEP_0184684010 /NCGR_PEP_ID=MMETSP0312-20130426/13505_1 /TAXON_ID=31354 /ORGANISM="Compsopogon coeruleus, Strain SAG 36.94" /LENGTH=717 /DNA_ID=CAMNT_0027136795 /DNA_START=78 /DNA_END=2231 /DNA_ORIENTATION=+
MLRIGRSRKSKRSTNHAEHEDDAIARVPHGNPGLQTGELPEESHVKKENDSMSKEQRNPSKSIMQASLNRHNLLDHVSQSWEDIDLEEWRGVERSEGELESQINYTSGDSSPTGRSEFGRPIFVQTRVSAKPSMTSNFSGTFTVNERQNMITGELSTELAFEEKRPLNLSRGSTSCSSLWIQVSEGDEVAGGRSFLVPLRQILAIRHSIRERNAITIIRKGGTILPKLVFPSERIAKSLINLLFELAVIYLHGQDKTLLIVELERRRLTFTDACGIPRIKSHVPSTVGDIALGLSTPVIRVDEKPQIFDAQVYAVNSLRSLVVKVPTSAKSEKKAKIRKELFNPSSWLDHVNGIQPTTQSDRVPVPFYKSALSFVAVSPMAWEAFQEPSTQEIKDLVLLNLAIFYGGVEPSARAKAWPFLLGVFSWSSTESDRRKRLEELSMQYAMIKQLWQAMMPQLEELQSGAKKPGSDVKRLLSLRRIIVNETKALEDSHMGSAMEGGLPLQSKKMQSILLSFFFHNKNLSYHQGTSSLLIPILDAVNGDENMGFWCFVGLMRIMRRNFFAGKRESLGRLFILREIIHRLDPDLALYFNHVDPSFQSCFRWVQMNLRFDVRYKELLYIWEASWTRLFAGNTFLLFVCAGILSRHRDEILSLDETTESLVTYLLDLSMKIDGRLAVDDGLRVFRVLVSQEKSLIAGRAKPKKHQKKSKSLVDGNS